MLCFGIEESPKRLFCCSFVARDTARNVSNHTLLAVQTIKPTEFCDQISLNMRNCWGILKSMVELVNRYEEDGRFVLLKDPMKNAMRLYAIPEGVSLEKPVVQAGGRSDDEDEEEEEDEEEGTAGRSNAQEVVQAAGTAGN